jgi:pimeloyl-ACP methyl ester carboxylesterase
MRHRISVNDSVYIVVAPAYGDVVTNTAVLLVRGAWNGPEAWDAVLPELDGYDVRAIALPSSSRSPGAHPAGMYDDAEEIRRAIDEFDAPVTVVAHSYGGIPAAEAVSYCPAVARIVFLASFVLYEGESMVSIAGGPKPHWDIDESAGLVRVRTPEQNIYADLQGDIAAAAIKGLRPQSLRSLTEPLTSSAWKRVPSTYVRASRDRAIPAALTEVFTSRTDALDLLDTGHAPRRVDPVGVARLVRAAAA